jgi:hypothetical protein
MFTCEYCFSHWLAFVLVPVTGFRLVYDNILGCAIAAFTVIAVANVYMTAYFILRQVLKFIGKEANKN